MTWRVLFTRPSLESEIARAAKGPGLLAAAARNNSAMTQKRAAHDKAIAKALKTGHGIVARRRKHNRPDAAGAEDEEEVGTDG
jgi:hypothetical protein